MATRPDQLLSKCVIVTKTVDTSQTATKGYGLIYSTDSDHVDDAGANGNAFAVALETKAAGESVQCVLLCGGGVVPVKVGTGGATAGKYAIMASDGWTDQTLGGGTTVKYIGGKFTQTGVVGDIVGMAVGQFAGVA
jgi:hypothetical protein